jgi:hypothetical protein
MTLLKQGYTVEQIEKLLAEEKAESGQNTAVPQ